jgi:hypothetical protein
MHVPQPSRRRAFRKIVTLLSPGATLLLTLRQGPTEPGRVMWPTSQGEIEALAREHGLSIIKSVTAPDRHGRPEVSWISMCLRLPDDGAGALPLLRGIILNDRKDATYKLALLRSVARIADGTSSLVSERTDEDAVDVPLGLVALNWVRMFLPLVGAKLPQRPGNAGPDGLGFAGKGFRDLSRLGIAAQDLRYGAQFTGDRAAAVTRALAEAARKIVEMPADHTHYPNSERRVFEASNESRRTRVTSSLVIDLEAMSGLGQLRISGHIWRAMQRMGSWVEPVLVAEWSRMMSDFAERMGRTIPPGVAEQALTWIDPTRDTALARFVAQRLIAEGSRRKKRALRMDWRSPQHR